LEFVAGGMLTGLSESACVRFGPNRAHRRTLSHASREFLLSDFLI